MSRHEGASRSPQGPETRPSQKFVFSDSDIGEVSYGVNTEAYHGCLVEAMKLSNRGISGADLAVESTLSAVQDSVNFAMTCGRCGITAVSADGIIYGAKRCPKVKTGEVTLGELA